MGDSHITSNIRAASGVSITKLTSVEANLGSFNTVKTNSVIASSLSVADSNYLIIDDGILSIYDNNRSKQLSVGRNILSFSIHHNKVKKNRWLKYNGAVGSNTSGLRLIRNATITGITIQTKIADTGSMKVIERSDTGTTDLLAATLNLANNKIIDGLNIDINKGSVLETTIVGGEFSYPTISVEIAWRF